MLSFVCEKYRLAPNQEKYGSSTFKWHKTLKEISYVYCKLNNRVVEHTRPQKNGCNDASTVCD